MTPLQRDTLEAVRRLTFNGVPPSYEDIRLELGLSNKSAVHRLLCKLRERGVVDFIPRVARSVVIVGDEQPSLERISRAVSRRLQVPIGEARAAVLEGWA